MTLATRAPASGVPGSRSITRAPCFSSNATAGCPRASRRTTSLTCPASVRSLFRNLRRTGVL